MNLLSTRLFKILFTFLGALFIGQGAMAQCQYVAPPVQESFDNPTIPPGCWTEDLVNGSGWETGQLGDPDDEAGNMEEHTGNGGFFAWVDFSGSGDTTHLVSPKVDVSGMTNPPRVSYWFFSYYNGNPNNTLELQAYDGSAWQTVATHTSDSLDWVRNIEDLSAYIFSDTVQVRLTIMENGSISAYNNDILLDDIRISETPSCPEPTALSATALSNDSVELSWTSNASGSEWEVEYGASGFTQGNGDTILLTNNPDTITGLAGGDTLNYDFYIREVCAVGDTSPWSGPTSVTTPCPMVFGTPFVEAFDDGNFWDPATEGISPCWDRTPDNTTDFSWRSGTGGTPSSGTGPDNDHTSGTGNYVFTEGSDGTTGDNAILTTPWIDLSSLTLPEFTYYYHHYGSDIDSFMVEVDTGSGFMAYDTIIGPQQSANSDPWKEHLDYLSAYTNDTVQFRFKAVRGGSYQCDYSVDDFKIVEAPSCPQPTDLMTQVLSGDSLVLNWTSNGSGTEWEIEYGPSGFALGSGTSIFTTDKPDTITGFSPNTSYDLYIREICGAGDTSKWSGPASFTTPCLSAYSPVYTTGFDQTNTDTPICWGVIDPNSDVSVITQTGHDDNLAPVSTTQMVEINDGNITNNDTAMLVSPRLIGLGDGDKQIKVYVNREDGGSSESIIIGTLSDTSNSATWTPIDTIPTEEIPTNAWGQKVIKFTDTAKIGSDDRIGIAHGPGTYEVYLDDFRYEFIPDTNVALQQITRPISKCDMDPDSITVRISNEGTQPQTGFDVAYTIDGGAQVVETVSQTVQPFTSITHTFAPTNGLAGDGTYDITAYTSLNGDTINMNDTSSVQVVNSSGSLIPANNPNKAIPTGDTLIEDTLFICGANNEVYECGRILSLTIDSLSHEDALDELDIQLVSPNGTVLNLWMQLGAFDEQGMNNLVFTDTASQNITAATGDPYTGTWRPQEMAGFAKFNGDDLNGMWRLRIFNDDGLDTANFKGWNMRAIDPQRPQPDLGPDTTICQRENLLLDPGNDPDWSYLWGDNSTDSSKAVAGSFLDTNTTYTYNVTVTDESEFNKCSNSDTIDVTIENCTGIEDQNGGKLSFKVHPNPATDQLKIQSEGAQGANFRYELMDLQGKTLVSKRNGGAQGSTMDVSALSKGVYILKGYRSDDQKPLFQQKVIVQ